VASAARKRPPIRGKLDEAGRLIEADPELEALQRDAGGAMGQQLAVPQIAAIARLARDLGTPVSRPAIAASADEDIDMWVNASPSDDESLELSLEQWRARPAAGPRLDQLVSNPDNGGADVLAPLEWSADEELRIIALSVDFAKLVGIDPEAAAGMPLTRLVQLEENDDGDMPLIGALAARHGFSGQRARLRSGQDNGLVLSGEIVTAADGSFAGFRGGAIQVGEAAGTPILSRQSGVAIDESLDEVLRQPLREIIETAGRIVDKSDGPLRGDYANYGNDIAAAARHLTSVIESMRGGAGAEATFEAQSVDVSALAAEAVVMVEPAAEARDVHFDLSEHPPLYAAAEERAVIQILVNLMGNAVRYSDPGGDVHILFGRTEGTVSVSIRDEGRGIDAADQERIFERFERADSAGAGTGLGLAISRRLARSMGGDIGVESRPGFGATFTLVLPGA
jgi:signal transduction histidine kinase